jgi:HAD superfamily hydrolase (TIGR01549 family)
MSNSNYKKNNFKAVFFDFGGTLMDAESDKKAHYYMMKEIKKIYQLPASAEELLTLYEKQLFNQDMTLKDNKDNAKNNNKDGYYFHKLHFYSELAFQSILQQFNKKVTPNDLQLFHENYLENHLKYIHLVEGAWEAILLVKERGYHCGIISDIDLDYQQEQFKALNIDQAFHSITTSEEVKQYKPAALIFQVALHKANCQGEETFMIGDSYSKDIIGGKNMAMTTIWINRYQNQIDKKNISADFTVTELKEILPILNNFL